jgi:ribosomal protein S18 acetylase RimI-like enzyme
VTEWIDDASAVRIVPADGERDLNVVRNLWRAYADALGVDLAFQGFEAELAVLPGRYAPPAGALLLARDAARRDLGCVALRPIAPPGCCEMKRLSVPPECRNRGIGRRLVEAVIDQAQRIGYREMRLDTLPTMKDAIALYEAAGFTPIAPYYETPIAGTIFYGRPLTL